MSETQEVQTTKILIDGVEHEAPLGGRLIDFLQDIGKIIPHFCYHPGLPVDASCRQCQVESKGKSSKPGLIVSCRETIVEGMDILTQSEPVDVARAGVIEFLLKNHPLDCPICDKAGECSLQDNAYETGQDHGRSHEDRHHFPKRKDLGEKILLDNERCILCRRCIRFFDHVTGEPQLKVSDRGERSILETFFDEPLHGNYQGNIVDLCPVGALTLKHFRFKSRPWFLHPTNTICGSCSRGCNTVVDVRDGKILRIRPRYNEDVNGYWMCDEGRLDFDIYNQGVEEGRLEEAMVLGPDGQLHRNKIQDAIDKLAEALVTGSGKVILLLSPWATQEEGETFHRLVSTLDPKNVLAGFYQPTESRKGDDLLRTDEDAPNCRGLRETGLEAIDEGRLATTLEDNLGSSTVFLTGFGLDALLPDTIKLRIKGAGQLLFHGFRLAHFPFSKIAIPAMSPMEKNGYWINGDGRKQYLRPALQAPRTILEDVALYAGLYAALHARLNSQKDLAGEGAQA